MAEFEFASPAQIVGYFAFFFGIAGLLQTKDSYLKILLIVHSLFYAGHFFLLDELGAVCGSLIAVCRISLSLFTRSWYVVGLLILANLIYIPFANDNWYALLPLLASCILTVGLFRFDAIPMRLCILAGSALWLIHNIIAGSLGGIALETLMLISTVITIFRIRKT